MKEPDGIAEAYFGFSNVAFLVKPSFSSFQQEHSARPVSQPASLKDCAFYK